jgi:hypothetical protein
VRYDDDIARGYVARGFIVRALIETCPQCDSDLGAGVMQAYASGRTFVPGTTCPECPGADKDPIDPELAALRREAAKAKRQAIRQPRRAK